MDRKKSNLDEQQEFRLLKIESLGFRLAFLGLGATMIVEKFVFGNPHPVITGETLIFLGLVVYFIISCFRVGIWDRYIDMSNKTNLMISCVAGLFVAAFGIIFDLVHNQKLNISSFMIPAILAFTVCYLGITLLARMVKKRQEKLNSEPENSLDK